MATLGVFSWREDRIEVVFVTGGAGFLEGSKLLRFFLLIFLASDAGGDEDLASVFDEGFGLLV